MMLGTTREGDCLTIMLLDGDERKRFYPSSIATLEATLEAIAAWAQS